MAFDAGKGAGQGGATRAAILQWLYMADAWSSVGSRESDSETCLLTRYCKECSRGDQT